MCLYLTRNRHVVARARAIASSSLGHVTSLWRSDQRARQGYKPTTVTIRLPSAYTFTTKKVKMGRLASGTTLDWSDIKKLAPVIRQQAVLQFLRVYEQEKERQGEPFKWGDEVSITIASADAMV